MTGCFRDAAPIICEVKFFSADARLDANLLQDIKCASVVIIEMTHSVTQCKFDDVQAHIRVLDMHDVARPPGEKFMTLKVCVDNAIRALLDLHCTISCWQNKSHLQVTRKVSIS